MNEKAKKKARQAELEFRLLTAHSNLSFGYSFGEWLHYWNDNQNGFWTEQARELIALYEGE